MTRNWHSADISTGSPLTLLNFSTHSQLRFDYFHYLLKYFPDRSIQKTYYSISKTEALFSNRAASQLEWLSWPHTLWIVHSNCALQETHNTRKEGGHHSICQYSVANVLWGYDTYKNKAMNDDWFYVENIHCTIYRILWAAKSLIQTASGKLGTGAAKMAGRGACPKPDIITSKQLSHSNPLL